MKSTFIPLCIVLCLSLPAAGHETDQWTLPAREFADMGESFTRWAHRIISRSVDEINEEIRVAIAEKRSAGDIDELQRPERLAPRVNAQIPWALDVIENLEKRIHGPDARHKYAGRLTAHKDFLSNVYSFSSLPFDPRQLIRMFYSSTIKAYGVHFGTDKVGHFTDMGMNYWRDYRRAIRSGQSEAEAMAIAVSVGVNNPILSENGFLGMVTAGSYSNADLVANYSGLLFYRNLTDPVMLEGQLRPPMVVRDGPFWKLNDHVRVDSDFFSLFISEHWDEALNPSRFDVTMRDGIRRNVRKHASDVLERHVDVNGTRRSKQWFAAKYDELSTYWGAPYGHVGNIDDQITIFNTCFETHPADADPKARNRFGETPLHQAAQRGHINRVRNLIASGAEVNARVVSDERMNSEWGNTPLHYACREGHLDVAQALIEAGGDVNAVNARGVTPLHRAIRHPAVIDLLIARGAKVDVPDVSGRTALHWASRDREADTISLLVLKGASVKMADTDGRTPLHLAGQLENAGAVNALIDAGADVTVADRWGGTPIHLAAGQTSVDALRAMLVDGANLKAADALGRSPLHIAADRGSPGIVALMLKGGAEIKRPDSFGNHPLHAAARAGRIEVSRLLVEQGADPNALSRSGYAPIHEAATAGVPELVRLLMNHGGRGDLRSPQGFTPLDLAARSGRTELEVLLRNGRGRTVAATE